MAKLASRLGLCIQMDCEHESFLLEGYPRALMYRAGIIILSGMRWRGGRQGAQ